MTFYVAPIVEGRTEVGCVTSLLGRIWIELFEASEPLQVLPPSRGNRDKLSDPKFPDLENKIGEAFAKLMQRVRSDSSGRGMLLLLLDAARDCPKTLAPRLLANAKQARSDADTACVLANWMLENWIVAGASSLAGVNGLPDPLSPRDQFEDRSGVAWLVKQLKTKNASRSYRKTADARVSFQSINLAECRANSPSFDKLCRELEKRLPAKSDPAGETTQP